MDEVELEPLPEEICDDPIDFPITNKKIAAVLQNRRVWVNDAWHTAPPHGGDAEWGEWRKRNPDVPL